MGMRHLVLAGALAAPALCYHPAAAQTTPPPEQPPALSGAPAPGVSNGSPPSASGGPSAASGSMVGSATLSGPSSAVRLLSVAAVKAMDLVKAGGGKIGDVTGVAERTDGQRFVVVERGGLLGVGARAFVVPVENLVLQNGWLELRNMEPAQFEDMPALPGGNNPYRNLDDGQQVAIPMQP